MKWNDYYLQFDNHFPKNPTNILEIGVRFGGGLRYLRSKFPQSSLYGVDYLPTMDAAYAAVDTKAQVFKGDQMHLSKFYLPPMDLVLDDGGHRPYQQAASFRYLWPKMPEGGVYIIEDFHMNFRIHWRLYGLLFGIKPILRRMIREQNRWNEGKSCQRSPHAIIFTPQLVILKKGTVTMEEHERIL